MMASACKRGMLSVSSVQGFPRTAEWRCGYSSTLLASITAPFGTGRAKPYLIIIMKKRTSFLNLTMLAAATLLSGNLTSCSSADGDSYVPSPTITDANGTAVQVTSVGNFRITYDEKGKLASLNEGGGTYVLQDDKFTFNNGAIRAEVFLNSDGLVTKIKYQETTINTQANKIREQEREIIEGNESIRKLTERLKEIQAHLSESKGKNEQAAKIIEELRLQAIEKNPKRYQQYEEELRKKYIHLNTKSLQFVASGEMLYDMFNKNEFEGIDFSSVIIEYGNCVEGLLKAVLVKKNIPITMRTGSKFAPIGQIINDCVHAKKYREYFEEGFYELLDEFNRKCRVTAAHGRGVDKGMMEKARGFLFSGNEIFRKGLLKYFDDLFL